MVRTKRAERVPLRVLLVIFAIAATAWAVSNILGARSDRDNLDACAASFRGDAAPGSVAFARDVASACAPLFRQRPCRDALAALAVAPDGHALDLGPAVGACAEAYCGRLDPPPPACDGGRADDAETLLAAILRADHSGYDEAAEIGALIARALAAPDRSAPTGAPAHDPRGTPP